MSIHGPTLLYAGEGAWSVSVDQTQAMLETTLDSRGIKRVNSFSEVNKFTKLIVIPGGHIVGMSTLLYISANEIKEYVNNGGRFLGICAGAIVATESCLSKPPIMEGSADSSVTALQKVGRVYRDHGKNSLFLSLYPGKCIAPHIVKDMNPRDSKNLCATDVFSSDEDMMNTFKSCHYSGPAFLETSSPHAKVLLRYKDPMDMQEVSGVFNSNENRMNYQFTGTKIVVEHPIAAVSVAYGNGQAVLTGIHPEMNPETFSESAKKHDFKGQFPEELLEDIGRQSFVKRIFSALKI